MRVYELDIEVLTPLIVARPFTGNIARHEASRISGRTMRGAFLFKSYTEGRREEVERENRSPQLVFHPAFPIVNGKLAMPAHPFIYQCKVCGEIADYLPTLIRTGFDLRAALPPETCPNGHMLVMKSLGGELVVREGDGFRGAEGIDRMRVENVGMSKMFRTSEVGMIYNYICIAPGQRFGSLIVDTGDGGLERLGYGLGQAYRLQLGRGGTRGLGYVEAEVRELEMESLRREVERRAATVGPHLLLLAKAPIFSISYDEGSVSICLHPEIPPLKYEGGWIPKTVSFSGFGLASGLPKAKLTCASPGSLYRYTLPAEPDDGVLDTLAKAMLVGLPPHNHLGLNLLEVV
ncbi:MAG: hypothetical protein QXV62_03070 [Nitrososphaerota archaeon]